MSETNTPASTSISVAGNETVTLADDIKKYKTKELIDFLRKEEELELEAEDLKIIRKQRVNVRDFFKTFRSQFCPLCKKYHEDLICEWWIDSQENKKCYLTCDNVKAPGSPGTPFVLEAYSENTVLNQSILWSYALKFPNKV